MFRFIEESSKEPGHSGVVVVCGRGEVIAANRDAVEILSGTRKPSKSQENPRHLSRRLRGFLAGPGSGRADEKNALVFENQIYACRKIPLTAYQAPGAGDGLAVILLCPVSDGARDVEHLAQRYSLSPRETETLRGLMAGLTTKEIAARMGISPSTVKVFIRMLNVKIGTTSRAGILATLLKVSDIR